MNSYSLKISIPISRINFLYPNTIKENIKSTNTKKNHEKNCLKKSAAAKQCNGAFIQTAIQHSLTAQQMIVSKPC